MGGRGADQEAPRETGRNCLAIILQQPSSKVQLYAVAASLGPARTSEVESRQQLPFGLKADQSCDGLAVLEDDESRHHIDAKIPAEILFGDGIDLDDLRPALDFGGKFGQNRHQRTAWTGTSA